MAEIRDAGDVDRAVGELVAVEPRFKTVLEHSGPPPLRRMPEQLASVLRIVTDQLVSTAAADAIWNRILARLDPQAADQVLRAGEPGLRELGLSAAKARTFLHVSEAYLGGHFDRHRLAALDDDSARRHLMTIPGIGPWSAEIYLLSILGRSDAWPAGDVALQTAAAHLFGLPIRPTAAELVRLAETWRPLRSVAARLLWCHYRTIRGKKMRT